jgi:Zn-dependent protease with chaperone function
MVEARMQPDIATLYPPNPTNVPPQLTRPNASYRLRAWLVVGSLALFLLVYLALIAICAFFSVVALCALANYREYHAFGTFAATMMIIGLGFVGIGSGLLALYFVKGLFKTPQSEDDNLVEITEAEQPRLFAFVRQICADTQAPAPAKIVLSPQVNASAFYMCTLWSLFFPVKKNLHIGLGLVNCLSLSEFKAVLAHEFGHFSQRSMRLGGFVYTANRIIYQIIWGRDALDEALSAFDPVLNLIRRLLGGIFRVINFAHASLSRQMEFQADLVAVSVSGSDAIIHGLLRSDFGFDCLEQTGRDLMAAGDHGIFTRDLFYHQSKSAEYLRILKDDLSLGIPPAADANGSAKPVFPSDDKVLPPMWASHPPHHQREENCRKVYVAGPRDDRSAWELFVNAEALRERLTTVHYKLTHKGEIKPQPAETVQRFIDDERAETIYSARYHGMYEDGLISPGVIDELVKKIPARSEAPGKLAREHEAIFSPELRERMAAYRGRRKERERLQRFAAKVEIPKGGVFDFRGKQHRVADIEKLLETLETEIKADHDHLGTIDRRIFLVYMGMAGQFDVVAAKELEDRYRFHVAVQEMIGSLTHWNNRIREAFEEITSRRDPTPEAIQLLVYALKEAQDAIGVHMQTASTLKLPAFRNMRAGDALSTFLDAKPVIHNLFGTEQLMSGEWIDQILQRHGEVIDKLRRVLFKSLGSLLCFQERLGERWKARLANAPAAPPPTAPRTREERLAALRALQVKATV